MRLTKSATTARGRGRGGGTAGGRAALGKLKVHECASLHPCCQLRKTGGGRVLSTISVPWQQFFENDVDMIAKTCGPRGNRYLTWAISPDMVAVVIGGTNHDSNVTEPTFKRIPSLFYPHPHEKVTMPFFGHHELL